MTRLAKAPLMGQSQTSLEDIPSRRAFWIGYRLNGGLVVSKDSALAGSVGVGVYVEYYQDS